MAHRWSGVLSGTAVILRSRWQIARNVFWRGHLLRKIGLIALVIVALAVSVGLYLVSSVIVQLLQQLAREQPGLLREIGDLPQLLAAVPSAAFGVATVPLLLSSFSFALSTLYLARDLDQLLVTPVPMRAVFLARFVEGLLPIYLLLFVVLLPALAGYGMAAGMGAAYLVALPVVLLLLPMMPVSVSVLLTMVLVRIIPARRLRELMAALGGLLGVGIYLGTQVLSRRFDQVEAAETMQQLLILNQSWLPTAWPARLLLGLGSGDIASVARYGALYLLVTAGFFTLTLTLFERLYYQGWTKVASTSGGHSRSRGARTGRAPLLRGPAGAIFLKDLRMLPRDLQRLSQLLMPLAFSIFWGWQLIAGRGSRSSGGSTLLISLTGIALLVSVMIASSIGLTGLSREGRGYWLIQLAPIRPWSILRGKLALTFLPFPVVGTTFVLLAWLLRRPPLSPLLEAWVIVMLTGVGVSAITTGLGAAFPRFDWNQAHRMTTFRASCLAPIAYYAYTGLMLMLTIGAARLAERGGGLVLVAGWAAALLLTAVACILPLTLASIRLRQLEM